MFPLVVSFTANLGETVFILFLFFSHFYKAWRFDLNIDC